MTEHELAERVAELAEDNARLRNLLARQGVAAELRHQIRNTLATMRTIMRRSAEGAGSVEDYVAHLEGRFDTILRIQSAVTRGSVEGADLHSIVSAELLSYLVHEGSTVHIEGPDLHLRVRAAELMALAVHELATNAIKFGALAVPDGRIAVTWRLDVRGDGVRELAFTWRESGLALSGQPAEYRGFGAEVLERMLAYELNADTMMRFRRDGLCWSMVMPVPAEIGSIPPPERHD